MNLTVKSFFRAENKGEIRQTYISSFPKNERMPFPFMALMSLLWNTRLLAFYDENVFCGFVYMATICRQSFIMFFAVPEALRSKGYGAKILEKVRTMYPKNKIIVSIEPCETDSAEHELRLRRRNFYIRNGYERSGFMMKLAGQEQEILVCNGKFDKGAFIRFFLVYSCFAIIPKIWECNIPDRNDGE